MPFGRPTGEQEQVAVVGVDDLAQVGEDLAERVADGPVDGPGSMRRATSMRLNGFPVWRSTVLLTYWMSAAEGCSGRPSVSGDA